MALKLLKYATVDYILQLYIVTYLVTQKLPKCLFWSSTVTVTALCAWNTSDIIWILSNNPSNVDMQAHLHQWVWACYFSVCSNCKFYFSRTMLSFQVTWIFVLSLGIKCPQGPLFMKEFFYINMSFLTKSTGWLLLTQLLILLKLSCFE